MEKSKTPTANTLLCLFPLWNPHSLLHCFALLCHLSLSFLLPTFVTFETKLYPSSTLIKFLSPFPSSIFYLFIFNVVFSCPYRMRILFTETEVCFIYVLFNIEQREWIKCIVYRFQFQSPCCGQGHLPLDQVTQSPIPCGLEHLQECLLFHHLLLVFLSWYNHMQRDYSLLSNLGSHKKFSYTLY